MRTTIRKIVMGEMKEFNSYPKVVKSPFNGT